MQIPFMGKPQSLRKSQAMSAFIIALILVGNRRMCREVERLSFAASSAKCLIDDAETATDHGVKQIEKRQSPPYRSRLLLPL
jgi:hypothetical protein